MGRIGFALLALLTVAVVGPTDLDAQGRGQPQRGGPDRDRNRAGDVWDVLGSRSGRDDRRGGGPPFCQNGQGHPVHGRQWCRDKGFGSGYGLEDIIFRNPRRNGRLNERGVLEQIGDVIFGRVQRRGYELGAREPLHGTWAAAPGGGQMLTIRSGSMIIAELIDQTLDGRVDVLRLR
jgi:hypothetical protein